MANGTRMMELFPENDYLRIRHAILVLAHVRGILFLKTELAPAAFATGLRLAITEVIQWQPYFAAGAVFILTIKEALSSQFISSCPYSVFGTLYNSYPCR